MFEEVIEEARMALGSGDEITLLAESGLATLYCKLGKHSMSRNILERAVEEATTALGVEHELTQTLVHALDECKREH